MTRDPEIWYQKRMLMGCVLALAAVALAGCGSSSAPAASAKVTKSITASQTPAPAPTLSSAQVASMVRDLYYGESQAYQRSEKQGYAYDLAHDYPGSERKSKFRACAAKAEALYPGMTEESVPEIDTLAPDPTWVGPPRAKGEADWLFAGKEPQGQTYILTVDYTYTYAGGQQQTQEEQVHVTIWDGVAYFYSSACPA
jgi:hypothetical protein